MWHKLQRKEADDKNVRDVMASEAQTEDAVLQGLRDARSRVQESESISQPEASTSPPNGSATSGHLESDPAAPSEQAFQGGDAQDIDTSKQKRGEQEAALGSSSTGAD